MDTNANDTWLSRQQLADRYGLPVKTLAQWAYKGTGPRYARMGRHVRYRLSDVLDWESARITGLPDAATRRVLKQVAHTARDSNNDNIGNIG